MKKTKVLIVDDSSFIRQLFTRILTTQADIDVIPAAANAQEALERIDRFHPDVITLDIEMPGMDGLTFLKKIMAVKPVPVIMSSSFTEKSIDSTVKALEMGAVDYVFKTTAVDDDSENIARDLIEKIKIASHAKVKPAADEEVEEILGENANFKNNMLFAIGASTGGIDAIKEILVRLPENFPAVIIAQHMPQQFTPHLVERLNKICQMEARVAANNDVIESGNIYVVPGGAQMEIIKESNKLKCVVNDNIKVSGNVNSADILFESIAKNVGNSASGIILTGAGKDGVKGMLSMKQAGCFNTGQDESSCVVYTMPKAAYNAGALNKQLPLLSIPQEMIDLAKLN